MSTPDRRSANDDLGMIHIPSVGADDRGRVEGPVESPFYDGFVSDGPGIDDLGFQDELPSEEDSVDLFHSYDSEVERSSSTRRGGMPVMAKLSLLVIVLAILGGGWFFLTSGDEATPTADREEPRPPSSQVLENEEAETTTAAPTTTASNLEAVGTVWEARGPGSNDTPFQAITGFYSAYYGDQNGVGERVAKFCPPKAENCNASYYQGEVVSNVAPNTAYTLTITSKVPGTEYTGFMVLSHAGQDRKYDTQFRVVEIDKKWYLADATFNEVRGA